MKKILILFCLSFLLAKTSNALDVSVTHAIFQSTEQSYLEVYLNVIGKTVSYQKLDGQNFKAALEITILIKQSEKLIKLDKYILNGPANDSAADFMDIKRYVLANGNYELEVNLQDVNDAANSSKYQQVFEIDFSKEEIRQSDIELLNSFKQNTNLTNLFVKQGVFMEPLAYNFYNKRSATLIFYNEIYNTDQVLGEDFMIRYGIEPIGANKRNKLFLIAHKRKKAQKLQPLLIQLDIKKLPSGTYQLFVEIRNKESKLLSRKTIEFIRANPNLHVSHLDISDEELENSFITQLEIKDLTYILKAIAPKIPDVETEQLNLIMSSDNRKDKERFAYAFFLNKNPNQPNLAYKKYLKFVKEIDQRFRSGLGFGFETDRGNIFMKYGPPSDIISVEDEPTAPPYEIWVYYDFPKTSQTNVKFLFYNPTLAGGNYELLHSTAKTEINNLQWQLELYKDVPEEINGNNYLDATEMQDGFNRRAARYFDEF